MSARSAKAAKVSQSVGYQPSSNGSARCGNCRQFEPPHACAQVEGHISPKAGAGFGRQNEISRRCPCRAGFSSCGCLRGRRVSRRGVIGTGVLIKPRAASAVPAFARQTGQPCATCHTVFPELTPFGRRFKLSGYTMGGGLTFEQAPPIAAMLVPTFTHTARNQDMPPLGDAHTNNNTILQQARLFYGGTIYENLGAFIQGTYDRATNRTSSATNSERRKAPPKPSSSKARSR